MPVAVRGRRAFLAPQPIIGGARTDDRIGYRFALFALPAFLERLSAAGRAEFDRRGIAVPAAIGPDGEAWLGSHGAAAALIRPDRYVLSTIGPNDPPFMLYRPHDAWLDPARVPTGEDRPPVARKPAVPFGA